MKIFLLILYFLVLIYIVFISGNDYRFYHVFSELGNISWIPLEGKIDFLRHPKQWEGGNMKFFLKEVFGNLLLLTPFPFILIVLFGNTDKKRIILYSFLISFSIEMIQFLTGLGNADVDDIILNTLGATLSTYVTLYVRKSAFGRSIIFL